jgi:hypothetical protein
VETENRMKKGEKPTGITPNPKKSPPVRKRKAKRMLTTEIVYTFVVGLLITVVAIAAFAASKSDPNIGKFAPVRVRVDERRRSAPPQREEPQQFTQWDVFFWLFVGSVLTLLVIAAQM